MHRPARAVIGIGRALGVMSLNRRRMAVTAGAIVLLVAGLSVILAAPAHPQAVQEGAVAALLVAAAGTAMVLVRQPGAGGPDLAALVAVGLAVRRSGLSTRPVRRKAAGPAVSGLAARCTSCPGIQTLASLTEFRGAERGANDRRSRATPGRIQPLPIRPSGTSGHVRRCSATLRECLLSSRSRVRVAVGAQVRMRTERLVSRDRITLYLRTTPQVGPAQHRLPEIVT